MKSKDYHLSDNNNKLM